MALFSAASPAERLRSAGSLAIKEMSCFSRSLSWRKELAHKSELKGNPALQSEMAPRKTKKGPIWPFPSLRLQAYHMHGILKCYNDQKIISYFPSDFESVFA